MRVGDGHMKVHPAMETQRGQARRGRKEEFSLLPLCVLRALCAFALNSHRGCIAATASALLIVALPSDRLSAQEGSALETAAAMERLVTEAIEKAEKSVVAIARVRRERTHRLASRKTSRCRRFRWTAMWVRPIRNLCRTNSARAW